MDFVLEPLCCNPKEFTAVRGMYLCSYLSLNRDGSIHSYCLSVKVGSYFSDQHHSSNNDNRGRIIIMIIINNKNTTTARTSAKQQEDNDQAQALDTAVPW